MDRILIKSDREYLREVFSRVNSGKYSVPSFQRDFIWGEDQIISLFDSILKGYPIGALTLWHSEVNYEIKDIITDTPIKDRVPDYFILDGRQRMTALYGCCIASKDSDNKKLWINYDLANNKLILGKFDNPTIVPIWEIYDTFHMLGRIQKLQNSSLPIVILEEYSNRLKEINTILQEYVISEILIEKCSLKEASEVFSRINSEGTQIKEKDMVQAMVFGKKGQLLVNKEIAKIKKKLIPYGFEKIPDQVILDCFYKFAGLIFYEKRSSPSRKKKPTSDLVDFNFQDSLPEMTDTIVRTAAFLHDKCYVLSASLLPYTRQFIALSWFFKEYEVASEVQEKELIKWFYYTTVKQSFMNGSLSNVRSIFNHFDSFVKGISPSAANYSPLSMPNDYTFRFSSKSALSNLVILIQIIERLHNQPELKIEKQVNYYSYTSSPVGYFPILIGGDKIYLQNLQNHSASLFDIGRNIDYKKYLLSEACLTSFWSRDYDSFNKQRSEILNASGSQFLKTLSLDVV